MFIKVIHAAILSAAILFGGTAAADTWALDSANSRLAFGSIKKNTVGEVHGFAALGGTVDADGNVALEIGLASVETNIEIRNERMNEHVFEGAPVATLSASMDMAEFAALAPGGIMDAKAGAVDDFKYSDAMAESDLVWDAETLIAFLAKPKEALPGTKMQFAGLRKDVDIENLLAYLADQ